MPFSVSCAGNSSSTLTEGNASTVGLAETDSVEDVVETALIDGSGVRSFRVGTHGDEDSVDGKDTTLSQLEICQQ